MKRYEDKKMIRYEDKVRRLKEAYVYFGLMGDSYGVIYVIDHKKYDSEVDRLSEYSVDVFFDRVVSGDIRKGEDIYCEIRDNKDYKKYKNWLRLYPDIIVKKY